MPSMSVPGLGSQQAEANACAHARLCVRPGADGTVTHLAAQVLQLDARAAQGGQGACLQERHRRHRHTTCVAFGAAAGAASQDTWHAAPQCTGSTMLAAPKLSVKVVRGPATKIATAAALANPPASDKPVAEGGTHLQLAQDHNLQLQG